jgi:hypothetical protein
MMKRIYSIIFLLSMTYAAIAQSNFISSRPYEEADRLESLGGKRGILILSKRSDLVITVTNAPEVQAKAAQRRPDGLFEYELVIDAENPRQPKVEVNRRGDVDRVDWVVVPKADYFMAYLIEETAKPIRLEDQTAGNSAILDASLCEVEFQTTISDLIVDCQELVDKGATIKRESKRGDSSIQIIRVIIPVDIIEKAKKDFEACSQAHQALYDQLTKKSDVPTSEWERLDVLDEQKTKAEETYRSLTQLNVYATGTNQLPVDISGLRPRSKMVYGVLLRTIIEEKHVSKCAGFMAEGGRQFALRKYTEARQSFLNALRSSDTPQDMYASIRNTVAQCDSCIKYEQLTLRALKRITELKNEGTVAQTDILNYYGAAADFMRIVEKYNPCEYYAKNIKTLETFIESMPLAMKFTVTRWVVDRVSAMEGGTFPGIELWGYYGGTAPRLNDYSSDRKFRRLASANSGEYRLLGTSDAKGIINMELDRKSLPTGFFFRPSTDNTRTQIVYKDMKEVMAQSVGEYNKRQFRMKMYVEK